MNESRNFYSGGHYLWWPNVCECRVRSSPIGWMPSHKNSYNYSTMYFGSPRKILSLEAHPSRRKYGKIGFCRFKRDKCDAKLWETNTNLANSDVTSRDIYYNLLEFWTTCDCGGSRIVYTSLINTKKILLCNQVNITQPGEFWGWEDEYTLWKSTTSKKFTNSWTVIVGESKK